MNAKERSQLRRELKDACAKVNRQIEVEETSVPYAVTGFQPRNQALIDALQAELDRLRDALANLGSDD